MMKDALGIIYTGENDHYLKEITQSRSIAAVPLWGRYRLIDFLLSNLVNSGIGNVGIIAQKNYHSLMDHVGGGREWDLNRKRDGLFILPPYVTRENPGAYNGVVDALRGIMPYLRRSAQRYVVFCNSDVVYKTTFDDMMAYHLSKKADITLMYYHCDDVSARSNPIILDVARGGRVRGIEIDPLNPSCNRVMLGAFIIEKTLLEYLVDAAAATGTTDFVRGVLMPNLDRLRIYGCRFNGYVACMDSVDSYFKHSLDLLDEKVQEELFYKHGTVFTKVRDEVPAHYLPGGDAVNSSVADGCVIQGHVENCVLFRGVCVGAGAVIKNSILFQDSEVQAGAVLENVILDKEVMVRQNRRLIGQDTYPIVIAKGAVI
nr:glucose-1-phosphate adenylyltransferase subunit GlgD [Maliibacterium massiliense]